MGSLANPQPERDLGISIVPTMDGDEFFFGSPAEVPSPGPDVQPDPEGVMLHAAE